MKMFRNSGIFLAVMIILGGCASSHTQKNKTKTDILKANIDSKESPGKDFYRYANGAWLKNNPIPATENRWGIGNLVKDEIYVKLKKISEDAAATKDAPKNTTTQRIGDLYSSAMDSDGIEKAGLKPLADEFKYIDRIEDKTTLEGTLDLFQRYNVVSGYSFYIGQDEKNSEKMMLHLSQGGLGLPNRDYYFNTDNRTRNIRSEYLKYIKTTLSHIIKDPENAGKYADDVLALETDLAKSSRKLEDLRDPYANYHKMGREDLYKMTLNMDWTEIYGLSNLSWETDSVIVGQPEFFTNLGKDIQEVSLTTWRNYLRFQLIAGYADKLGSVYDKEHFAFYGTVLTGTRAQKPRWKRVIDYENVAIGELLGQAFVKEYFPAETKARYVKLVDAVLAAYKHRLENESWMSDATKQKAVEKLNAVTKKIGYPDKWKDFTGMEISKQPYVRNAIDIDKFWFQYRVNKIGKPVDRQEWDMNPQEYNAYYNPSNNEIVLPAAAFAVPGFRDDELDDALVYGYAGGSTIGHEITHGFDDEGHQFDAKGNLQNWWTKDDEEKFKARTQMYVDQFNKYVVLDSLHVNGKATLGENIADLGGIVIGLDAFKQTEEYKSGKLVGGLTPLQRYFLGYALGWMVQQRNERLANQILTDVHAPADLRVNGPLSNVPEFYEAFGVKKGDALWREEKDRVVIW
jgi:putative endopeptidase